MYTENYKTLLKEIKDLKKWKDMPNPWIGRVNIVKIMVPFQLIHRLNTISSLGLGNGLLDITAEAQATKENIDILYIIKI